MEPSPEEKAEELERKKSRAYQTQLCHKMEGLARSKDLEKAVERVGEAAREWSELGGDIDEISADVGADDGQLRNEHKVKAGPELCVGMGPPLVRPGDEPTPLYTIDAESKRRRRRH